MTEETCRLARLERERVQFAERALRAEHRARLLERERVVLALRYGLADDEPHTLETTGAAIGVTRERARQIEAEALRKLRHPALGQGLRGYLTED